MRRPANAFWRFSLRTYRLAGVAAACLALQERWGADVNLVLYCCWLGRAGRALDRRSLRSAGAAVSRWQAEVIKPLRQARRAMKQAPKGLSAELSAHFRKRIGALELDLEYVEQCLLARAAQSLPRSGRTQSPVTATLASLGRYLALLGLPAGQADPQVLVIVNACYPRSNNNS